VKISLNWLKQYVDINIPTDELVKLIGARLVEIEEVIDQTHKYDNIFIAKVVECEKIPETHLSLCQIDIGKKESIQVVCGAPNVHKGMLAAWISPGATVPSSCNQDAPFILGTRKIRGYESNGMLAGADELDFGTDHGGIVEIDPQIAKPGDKLADLFDLNDTILDVENKPLTRRPDCFGIIGFAREIAGILGQPFKTPDFLIDTKSDFTLSSAEKLIINLPDPELCPRYTVLIMSRKDESKKYLKELDTLISRSGMRPIDPIVDLTNYLMLLTGQPLHAFDYDKLIKVGKTPTPKIIVRAAKPNEKLALLDGRTIKCTDNDILITSNNTPVALAGAMGCQNTVIDENTKKIIIESATFSLYNLRKTQMQHGIFSEAITRFTKGQPAGNTLPVIKQFATLSAHQLKPLAIFDEYPKPVKPSVVKITTHNINSLLGTDYTADLIKKTLENVGFGVTAKDCAISDCAQMDASRTVRSHDEDLATRPATAGARSVSVTHPSSTSNGVIFTVTPPYWRTDIHIKEDIIEEVGRLLGYDNITPTTPPVFSATPNPMFTLKTKIRNILSNLGANEILTYSFVSERLVKNANQDPKNSYRIINSISPDLQLFRQSLIPSLLDKTFLNVKVPYDHFALFEMNKVYQKAYGQDKDGLPIEKDKLALVLTNRKSNDIAYYEAKLIAEQLFAELNIKVNFNPIVPKNATGLPFEQHRSADVKAEDGTHLGIVGEFKKSVLNNFKLPAYTAGFDFNLNQLLELAQPTTKADPLALVENATSVDITINSSAIYQTIHDQITKILDQQNLIFTVKPQAIYQPKGKTTKNLSFHLEFAHPDKTLDSTAIDAIMKQLEQIK